MKYKSKGGIMKELVDKHKDRLKKKKNVVGVGVGEKWTNGKSTGEPAILIFVGSKEPKSKLEKKDLIEKNIDGVKTDVVGKSGRIVAQLNSRRERPIKGGISVGHLWVTAGTIGGFFLDRHDHLVMLSNAHVLAAENRGIVMGERKRNGRIASGHITIQPGKIDGGRQRDIIGNLKKYVKLQRRNNKEDSAIAKVRPGMYVDPNIKNIGMPAGFRDANVGLMVQKSGRTTGYTRGKIIAVNVSINVEYDMGILEFDDCIVTDTMSRGGDSGSILCDMSRRVVGLLFAGSNTVTVYNPIKYPRSTYGLKIWVPKRLRRRHKRRRR